MVVGSDNNNFGDVKYVDSDDARLSGSAFYLCVVLIV